MGESDARRLSAAELALEADTSPERIARLVAIGAIKPADDGSFGSGDVVRSRVLAEYEAAGITLDQVAIGIRDEAMTLDFIERFYPTPSPLTGRTYGEFTAGLGDPGRLVSRILPAMGLPTGEPNDPTREADEAIIRAFLETWALGDDEVALRAARIFGDAVQRAADGWVALFEEVVPPPATDGSESLDELAERVVTPAARTAALAPRLLVWLLERHMERSMNALNIAAMERELERRGLVGPRPIHPPAIAFVDLSGYTRLTQEHGDEVAATTTVRLGELADGIARSNGGRVVKLLGDGVLLAFDRARDAVVASLAIVIRAAEVGLPAVHAGVDAGGIIRRDGDVYGNTVNVAARVAGQAHAGEVLVTEAVVEATRDDPATPRFDPVGTVELKGVRGPTTLHRAVSRDRT
jgi:adenylate cyclase